MCEKVEFIKITANDKSDVLYADSIRTKLPSYVIRKKRGYISFVGGCDISVDRLTATRLLFGYTQPIYQCEKAEKFMDFCPLPLTWNLQDRV